MRLFTGISVAPDVLANLSKLLNTLRSTADVKWSPAENLHLTMKFIGEWPEERLNEMIEALRRASAGPPIEISINGLGWFPNPHSPRVLVAAVHAPESLRKLAHFIDETTHGLGVPMETRPYSPHLTLAKIKNPGRLFPLKQAIASLPTVDFGSFTARDFHLYLSKMSSSGSVYTRLADFSLANS
jgi:RNA 2',3'-cyclic 3'-phosphodiesterase